MQVDQEKGLFEKRIEERKMRTGEYKIGINLIRRDKKKEITK